MFKKIGNIYDHFEEIFLVVCIIIMVVIIFLQVVMRYAFNYSLSWTEELARILFIWISWIGISLGEKRGEHITITLVKDRLKGNARTIFLVIGNILTLAILMVLIVKGIAITGQIYGMTSTTAALHIPKWIMFVVIPISCSLMTVRILKRILTNLFRKGGEVV